MTRKSRLLKLFLKIIKFNFMDESTKEQEPPVNKSLTTYDQPQVYKSVRAVGIVKPFFQPNAQGQFFTNKLDVIGTAFWLKKYKVLITCAHVVQNLLAGPLEFTGLLMVGNAGIYSRAVIASLDIAHDLAVLKIVGQPQEFINTESESGLEIVDSYPQVGETVGYAGFPLGLQLLNNIHSPTYAEGVVGVQLREGEFRKEIQITGSVAGGFSGAPVVSKNAPTKVAGVLSSGPTNGGNNLNIFMASSWVHLKAIADLSIS